MLSLKSRNRVLTWPVACAAMVVVTVWLCPRHAVAQRVRLGDSFVTPAGQNPPAIIRNTGPGLPPLGPTAFPQTVTGPGDPLPQSTLPATTLPPTINTQPVLPTLQNPFPNVQPGVIPGQVVPGQIVLGQNIPAPFPGPGIVPNPFPGAGGTPTQPPPFIYPPPLGNQPAFSSNPGFNVNPGIGNPAFGVNNPFGFNGASGSNGSWGNSATAWPGQVWARLRSADVYRLLERPRWRHTFLSRDSSSGDRGLGLNETDIATTISIPNFLFSSQPIRISPGFIFHFWDGPDTALTTADLPGQTYSVYLANDFTTPWNRRFGVEANLTVGLYTDFQEVTTDSIRITGVGLGWYRLNNTTTFKAGIEYLDRLRISLLPAIGFFIYPTNDLKLDLYFPRPRISQRFRNLGNTEVWGYVGGEYGGGSWTVERVSGVGDQVDVNDIRAFVGLEWIGPRRVSGFFEAGYVFDREIIYRADTDVAIDIDDAFMLRAGLAF